MAICTLTALLNHAAAKFPSRRAISVSGKLDLTHARLNHLVDHAAAQLIAAGVKLGDVVALTFPNTVEVIVVANFSKHWATCLVDFMQQENTKKKKRMTKAEVKTFRGKMAETIYKFSTDEGTFEEASTFEPMKPVVDEGEEEGVEEEVNLNDA